jgi:hypothetical protein
VTHTKEGAAPQGDGPTHQPTTAEALASHCTGDHHFPDTDPSTACLHCGLAYGEWSL